MFIWAQQTLFSLIKSEDEKPTQDHKYLRKSSQGP